MTFYPLNLHGWWGQDLALSLSVSACVCSLCIFCSLVGLYSVTFQEISPGCQSYSLDTCEKSRQSCILWHARTILPMIPASLKRSAHEHFRRRKYSKSPSFILHVVCHAMIKDTPISNCDLTSRQHSSRLRSFQLVKTWLKSCLGSPNHWWRGRREGWVESCEWLRQTKRMKSALSSPPIY